MPASLLESQLAILEPPGPDEHALTVAMDAPIETVVERMAAALIAQDKRDRRTIDEGGVEIGSAMATS